MGVKRALRAGLAAGRLFSCFYVTYKYVGFISQVGCDCGAAGVGLRVAVGLKDKHAGRGNSYGVRVPVWRQASVLYQGSRALPCALYQRRPCTRAPGRCRVLCTSVGLVPGLQGAALCSVPASALHQGSRALPCALSWPLCTCMPGMGWPSAKVLGSPACACQAFMCPCCRQGGSHAGPTAAAPMLGQQLAAEAAHPPTRRWTAPACSPRLRGAATS
jgi:hypothetical protein